MSAIILGAVILGGALFYAISRKPKPTPAKAAVPSKPVAEQPSLPQDEFTISVDVAFRTDGAFSTMHLRGLVRVDYPQFSRDSTWKPISPSYSIRVLRGDHSINIQTPFAGRNFIDWIVLPDTGILQTSNPLVLFINEDKHLTAEFD